MHIEYDNIDDDELEKELKALEEQALKDVEALTANNVSVSLERSIFRKLNLSRLWTKNIETNEDLL